MVYAARTTMSDKEIRREIIYVHKDVIGTEKHLYVLNPTHVGSIDYIPGRPFLVFGEDEIIEVAKVYGITLPTFPSRNNLKAMRSVLNTLTLSEVPWSLALSPEAYTNSVKGLAGELGTLFDGIDLSYYRNYYRKTMPLLKKFQKAKIDPVAFKLHSLMTEKKSVHLDSFAPDENGFAQEVIYSKSDTVTGRLKVVSGPNILHLRKDERNIIASRFGHKEGRVWMLDFKSIEPRIILGVNSLKEASGAPSSGSLPLDLYTHVINELQLTGVTRDSVKQVVITQLYGASHDTLLEKLGDSIEDKEGFISVINNWFGLDKIKERLLEEYEASDRKFIRSWYGRPVSTIEAKPYMLLNRFAQSTAVDVALMGFSAILDALEGSETIVPIFCLHDALFLDVRRDQEHELERLCEIGSKNIPLFPGIEFPIKADPLL